MLETTEHPVAIRAAGQRIGELSADQVDDRRAQKEVPQIGG